MIYEWQCKKCGKVVEVERKLKDFKLEPTEFEVDWCAEASEGAVSHQWERIIGCTSTPFQHLRHSGVFADEHGNFAPWSRNM